MPQVYYRGSTFLQSLTKFSLSCFAAMSSIITSHKSIFFLKSEMGFTCEECNVGTDTGPSVLNPIQEDTKLEIDRSKGFQVKAAFHPYVNNLCFVLNLVLFFSVPHLIWYDKCNF